MSFSEILLYCSELLRFVCLRLIDALNPLTNHENPFYVEYLRFIRAVQQNDGRWTKEIILVYMMKVSGLMAVTYLVVTYRISNENVYWRMALYDVIGWATPVSVLKLQLHGVRIGFLLWLLVFSNVVHQVYWQHCCC